MYRSATLAMVVSSTSMNVGTTTATATNQGLIAGRPSADEVGGTLLMGGLHRRKDRRRTDRDALAFGPSFFTARRSVGEGVHRRRGLPGAGRGGSPGEGMERLQERPG